MVDLTVCLRCGRDFVYPVDWHEISKTYWHVLLRCGGCGRWRVGNYDNATVDALDTKLNDQLVEIEVELRRMVRASMIAELSDFVEALAVDAILPEDF